MDVIDTLIVAALVNGNDTVGVIDIVDDSHRPTGMRGSGCTRKVVNGVDQDHDVVPVHERDHDHGRDHANADGHGHGHVQEV